LHTWVGLFFVVIFAACTAPKNFTTDAQTPHGKPWQGRINITVQSDPPRSMSASFSLEGDAQNGELHLFSPLGTTLASLQWRPGGARWLQDGQLREYDSIAQITEEITGAALPMVAMFDWLEGRLAPSSGWQADLSALASGTLVARRVFPEPFVVLRIKLDTP
jgi:outer membrane lipoprotein LolB